jgi:hypothetical protein
VALVGRLTLEFPWSLFAARHGGATVMRCWSAHPLTIIFEKITN